MIKKLGNVLLYICARLYVHMCLYGGQKYNGATLKKLMLATEIKLNEEQSIFYRIV